MILTRILKALILLIAVLSVLLFSLTPSVPVKPTVNFSDLGRVQSLLKQYHPNNLKSGERYILMLHNREFSLLPATMMSGLPFANQSNISLKAVKDGVHAEVSYPFLRFGIELWLNMDISVAVESGAAPALRRLRTGWISWPGSVLQYLEKIVVRQIPESTMDIWRSSAINISPVADGAHIGFTWNPGAGQLIPGLVMSQQKEQLHNITHLLSTVLGGAERIDIEQLFSQLLDSWEPDERQVELIFVILAQYLSGTSLSDLFAVNLPDLPETRIYLSGRQDWARHFILSAMLASQLSPETASDLGFLKELSDADNKLSGFSISDLLANQAGVLFIDRFSRAAREGTLIEFKRNLSEGLLPEKASLDALDQQETEWSAEQVTDYLKTMRFYSIN